MASIMALQIKSINIARFTIRPLAEQIKIHEIPNMASIMALQIKYVNIARFTIRPLLHGSTDFLS